MSLRFAFTLLILIQALALGPGLAPARAAEGCTPEEFRAAFRDRIDRARKVEDVYRLGAPLGEGSYGKVQAGTIPANLPESAAKGMAEAGVAWPAGTPVAVKVQKSFQSRDTLSHEAELMKSLSAHDRKGVFLRGYYDPNRRALVTARDPALITLKAWMQGKVTPSRVRTVSANLDAALGILKAAGIVHSDLKPANILIHPRTMRILILDFGISARVGGYPSPEQNIRGGTPEYAPQDQWENKPASTRDDLHAVGVIKRELNNLLPAP